MAAPMTGRERVLAALRRQPVDRTPVCNPTSIATLDLMDLVDAPFPAANRPTGTHGAPRCHRPYRTGLRFHHARFQHGDCRGPDLARRKHQQPGHALFEGSGASPGRGVEGFGRWRAVDRAGVRRAIGHAHGQLEGDPARGRGLAHGPRGLRPLARPRAAREQGPRRAAGRRRPKAVHEPPPGGALQGGQASGEGASICKGRARCGPSRRRATASFTRWQMVPRYRATALSQPTVPFCGK